MNSRYLLLSPLIFLFALSCGSKDINKEHINNMVKIEYQVSDEVISNPERGFMRFSEAKNDQSPISEDNLKNLAKDNMTLVTRVYYLIDYRNSDISNTYLKMMESDMKKIRNVGLKCVIRFAYSDNIGIPDAPIDVVEKHLDQLKPIFQENADVIAFVQAGFVGAWGEWHASTNDLTSLINKKRVTNKLLQVLPKNVKVQLRTPIFKQEIFEYNTAMGSDIGYGDSDKARVGFHNDCFLTSIDDYGTYTSGKIAQEKKYISDEAVYVPVGGETCIPLNDFDPNCLRALKEVELLKFTYLNIDWYIPTIDKWRSQGCFKTLQKKLGYRLSLQYTKLKKEISANDNLDLEIGIDNFGYAPIYSKKNTFLVFKSTKDASVIYKKNLNFDIRKVTPSETYIIKDNINTSDIPKGEYNLFLKVEDSSDKIAVKTAYCIQFANKNIWDDVSGLNNLNRKILVK